MGNVTGASVAGRTVSGLACTSLQQARLESGGFRVLDRMSNKEIEVVSLSVATRLGVDGL